VQPIVVIANLGKAVIDQVARMDLAIVDFVKQLRKSLKRQSSASVFSIE